jgi:hypothetical protein
LVAFPTFGREILEIFNDFFIEFNENPSAFGAVEVKGLSELF